MTRTADGPTRVAAPTLETGPGTAAGTPHPRVALLSNGRYGVVITGAGGGSATWRDLDVTRWREDTTRDCWGQFCYVRDRESGTVWSTGHQPICRAADEYAFAFHADRAEFRRRGGDMEPRWAVCIASGHDAEVRLFSLANHGGRPRHLDLTSYAEVCLNDRRADQSHPAFAKLFLETEFNPHCGGALLARRRPRGVKEHPVWAVHTSTASVSTSEIEYETDRMRFLGRGRTTANPVALDLGSSLSRTTGPVLDPIFSLRRRLGLEAGMTARISFVTGAADTREIAIGIAERFRESEAIDRAFAGAKASCQTELRELGLTPNEIAVFDRLAAAVLFTNSRLRDRDAVAANRLGQSRLWSHSISGDLPIVLVRVAGSDDETLVRQLIQWRLYTLRRGLKVELVILDERPGEPADRLPKELQTGVAGELLGKPGGVFFLTADKVPSDEALLLAAAARA